MCKTVAYALYPQCVTKGVNSGIALRCPGALHECGALVAMCAPSGPVRLDVRIWDLCCDLLWKQQ